MERKELIGNISIIGVFIFVVSMALAVVSYPGYNIIEQFMSELGIGPAPIFFNLGIILTGLFLIPFYLAFYSKSKLSKLLTITGIISAIGLIGVGVFPMDVLFAHTVLASIFFLGSAIAIAIYDFEMLFSKRQKVLCMSELLISVVIILYIFVYGNPVMQKFAVFLIFLWVVLTLFEHDAFRLPFIHE